MDVISSFSVLKNLGSGKEQVVVALKELEQFINSTNSDRAVLLREGVIKCIVGLLRCSRSIDVLTVAVSCLDLAVFGCEEICYEIAQMGLVQIILTLLKLIKEGKIEYVKTSELVSLQERLISLLRRATYNCQPSHTSLVSDGGIAVIVRLINEQYDSSTFPPEMLERLTELTRNKCFTAAVTKVPQHRRCNVIQNLFPALSALGEVFTQQYPLFSVDLSDSNKQFITDILTDEGLAISEDTSSSMEDVSWIILRVTHVSGPQQLWAEFSIDKRMEEHRDILKYHKAPPPNDIETPPISVSPGCVYSIYNPAHSIDVPTGWYRGWLLSPPFTEGNLYSFFCMDYGFTVSVPRNCIRQLPATFKGLTPRAAPCVLTGIKPAPTSVKLLQDVTGILRNLSFESCGYLQEMLAQGVVPLLIELASSKPCTDEMLCHCNVCLMNLCQLDEACKVMFKLGAVQILTNILVNGASNNSMVQKSLLGCLAVLLTQYRESKEVFRLFDGPSKVKAWLESGLGCDSDTELCVKMLMDCLDDSTCKNHGPISAFSSCIATTNNTAPQPIAAPAPITTAKKTPERKQVVTKSPSNTKASPVYRVMSQDSGGIGHVTGHVTQDQPMGFSPMSVPSVQYGSHIIVETNQAVEYINVDVIAGVSLGHVLRSLCGVANTENGGSIYIGVLENGRAKGIGLNRNEKNNVRLDLDQLVTQINPPIISSRYGITFIPVTGTPRIKDQFIVCIQVRPSSSSKTLHVLRKKSKKGGTSKEECYIHKCGKSMKISMQDVREIVAEKELEAFNNASP